MLLNYAKIFNEKKLFLKFNGLQLAFVNQLKELEISGEILDNLKLFSHYYNEFLHHSYSVYCILEQMNQLELAILKQYNELKPNIEFKSETLVEYESFIVNEYLNRIMPFLNTLFILQDRIMVIIAIYLDITFERPKKTEYETERKYKRKNKKFKEDLHSFASYSGNKYGILKEFPIDIQKLVKKYWNKNGQKIRNYRNLEQHQFNLLEEAYLQLKPTERFILRLPDNPNERDFEKLTYSKKIIASDFFKTEFHEFHNFVETLMYIMKIRKKKHNYGTSFSPKSNSFEKFNEGDLMKIWVIKKEVLLFSVGEKSTDGKFAKIKQRKIDNKIDKIILEIQD